MRSGLEMTDCALPCSQSYKEKQVMTELQWSFVNGGKNSWRGAKYSKDDSRHTKTKTAIRTS